MGYLFKEALKTLCGVNQWSYAVFWKTGSQNPNLLIWEECYYEPASCYGRPRISGNGTSSETPNLQHGVPGGNRVHLLVNKMMADNHINVIGEGLVGRVAFTGNQQWILSENYYRETHPPEVLKEVCLQFSAGMQTVAVVPILPHGVAQFGSYLPIAEDVGFVNGVMSLIAELGCVPGVLQSANHEANELAPKVGFPLHPGYSAPQESPLESNMIGASSFFADSLNYVGCSAQSSAFDSHTPFSLFGEIQNEMQSSIAPFQAPRSSSFRNKPYDCHEEAKTSQANKSGFSFSNQFMNGLVKAEVIPSNSIARMNRYSPLNIMRSIEDLSFCSSSTLSHASTRCTEQKISCDNVSGGHFIKPVLPGIQVSEVKTNSGLVGDDTKLKTDACFESQSGDDLFDVLGADFKDEWFVSSWKSCLDDQSATTMHNCGTNDFPSRNNLTSPEIYSSSQGKSDSGILSFPGTTGHLLDAVVSKVHPFVKQSLDEDMSCSTSLNDTSGSSASKALLHYGRIGVFDNVEGDLLGMPKCTAKGGIIRSSSSTSTSLREDSGIYGQGGSVYDPWIERSHNIRQSNSVPTGYSTRPHEASKTNRKRLKPGENPRPRPKDRQMIQDRVKELREIVPNGAKCSIDALLERTIKHMLFLQSVTKHADKLKQNAESKIISKDGGLLLKDNFGGATWAYEVGSQSMVCPIIVEDLNQPHQMLVEMLCEERGLFLEIADIIRGLGLTILKGLMETRNDKIWARFAVEANRSVTRMEIFLSLVRLLEQNAKGGVPQSDNVMVQEARQAASIPASDGSRND
ncbi:transcription factor LHW-like isoform X2 [Salvia miltiorrhiza]|uniref:transcription factor LHW-like isoform X2 n=1 Tax=Salvia miltiorrhiza TaxID=226208 RepID=UPI0025AC00DF|nr:transcription factor LHW-like isoform X2 [Salvia miltiorrhiza]